MKILDCGPRYEYRHHYEHSQVFRISKNSKYYQIYYYAENGNNHLASIGYQPDSGPTRHYYPNRTTK